MSLLETGLKDLHSISCIAHIFVLVQFAFCAKSISLTLTTPILLLGLLKALLRGFHPIY